MGLLPRICLDCIRDFAHREREMKPGEDYEKPSDQVNLKGRIIDKEKPKPFYSIDLRSTPKECKRRL